MRKRELVASVRPESTSVLSFASGLHINNAEGNTKVLYNNDLD